MGKFFIKKKVEAKPALPAPVAGESPLRAVMQFLDECRKRDTPAQLGVFLQSKHQAVFGTPPPTGMLCLIRAKIAYRLQLIGMKSGDVTPSKKFMQNYEASQKMDMEGFDDELRFWMESDAKKEKQQEENQGESHMVMLAKKSAKAAATKAPDGQGKKGSVTRTWIELMSKQPSTKLSDAALAAEMRKRHPDKKKYSEADVASVRSLFNRGKLVGQKGKPGKPLEEVVKK